MVIVKMLGGLGNQMFEYAAAKSLSIRLKTQFQLDTDYYNHFDLRVFELDCFKLKYELVDKKEVKICRLYDIFPFLKIDYKNRSKIFKLLTNKSYFKEKSSAYFSDFFKIKNNTYIDGYWNSEKYFKSIEKEIRHDFEFKNPPHKSVKKYIASIGIENAVSLHVRRTDYAYVKKVKLAHGLCSLNYYNKAIEKIASKVGSPVFYVFSDDKEWVRKNIKSKYKMVYVNHQGKDYEDMRLMSLCKHNIVANSTFSWWGAWLNRNKEKVVIAPKKWFQAEHMNDKDICPKEWKRI